ncbi:MAG: CHAP domain-containing protein [Oscillospiraceae bacterium]|nr:CHAP domain-containing protein [Oscillospiraceae bacterium]MBR3279633.1 CHAP domain-containing protein [Lachnospiraceae bacterium]
MAGSFKDISMRTRDDLVEIYGQDKGSYEYAPDVIQDGVAESSAYALKGGIEIFHRNGTEVPDVLSGSEQNIEGIQRSEAEYGRKSILNRQTKAHLADDEVLRNAEEYRTGGRIKWGGADRNAELIQRKAAKSTLNRYESPKTAELIQQRRREYVIKRLRESKSGRGFVRSSVAGSQRLGRNVADRMGKILKGTVTSAKTLFNSLTAGGAAALLVVVIMVVFGAAFTFTEDGNQIVGTGDDAIVEVAKAELGNVGGDKFWKWYGFTSHVDWCAIFCSWCADQCGYIEAGILPKFSVVGDGASWFKARHRWSGRGYSPKPGDFIFFDFEQDGVLDHVGIVESCDGKVVTTIEGNSGNVCKRLSYRVGSASIAGYGLMIRPSGNKARQLALKAINLAYPDAPDKAKYHGGEPTAAYAAALNRAYPNRSGWGQPSKDGASCDVFVGTCIVDSGVDKGFPRGYRDQKTRLASRTDLYECVVSTTSSDVKESELKDGDIVTWEKSSGTVHIFIYAGGKARHAAHDKWYGRTTAVGNNLKISGKTMLMYGKEASNRKQEIDRQHYTIPNQRPKDKHCGKI